MWDKVDIYALSLIKGLGKRSIFNLINSGITMSELLSPDDERLSKHIKGAGKKDAIKAIQNYFIQYREKAANDLKDMSKNEINVITFADSEYPHMFKRILDPPLFLFAKGNLELLNYKKSIAIIGTRECSNFGKQIAINTSKYFAEKGFNIVSGLATGIDTAGHKGALAVGGMTTAVLTDIDKIYPHENEQLAEDILLNGGLLFAENPPGTFAHRGLFISRDRLQSALSLGVFPIETDIKGGTMHTVRFGEDQGKKIFCPDLQNIFNYPLDFCKSKGILDLIDTGRARAYTKNNYQEVLKLLSLAEDTLWGIKNDQMADTRINQQLSLTL